MTDAVMRCANHPDRETTLRCNRCEKPICTKCAVLTPVGYRCRECVRGQQAIFETATPVDYVVTAVVSALGTGLALAVLNFLGFWGLLLAPVAGGGIAEVARFAARRRRGRRLPLIAAIAGALGVVPHIILPLVTIVLLRGGDLASFGGTLLLIVLPVANGVLMVGSLYYRLRGIRL